MNDYIHVEGYEMLDEEEEEEDEEDDEQGYDEVGFSLKGLFINFNSRVCVCVVHFISIWDFRYDLANQFKFLYFRFFFRTHLWSMSSPQHQFISKFSKKSIFKSTLNIHSPKIFLKCIIFQIIFLC